MSILINPLRFSTKISFAHRVALRSITRNVNVRLLSSSTQEGNAAYPFASIRPDGLAPREWSEVENETVVELALNGSLDASKERLKRTIMVDDEVTF